MTHENMTNNKIYTITVTVCFEMRIVAFMYDK